MTDSLDITKTAITQLLDERTIKDQENGKGRFNAFPLRPSSAGLCSRRLAYETTTYLGKGEYPTEPRDPNVVRLLNLGHSIEFSALRNLKAIEEDGVRVIYKQLRLECAELPGVTGKHRYIEGSCDGVFECNGKLVVFDIKSTKDRFSAAYQTAFDEKMAKFEAHEFTEKIGMNSWLITDISKFLDSSFDPWIKNNILQLNLYGCAPFLKKRKVEQCLLFYYSKNDSRHYEIRWKPSQPLANKVKKKFITVYKTITKEDSKPEDVDRDSFIGSAECAFCDYRSYCWPSKDALKEYFKNFPDKEWPQDVRTQSKLGKLMKEFEVMKEKEVECDKVHQSAVKLMVENGLKKIRLKNGHVYEAKFLKSKGIDGRYELRRTKL